MSLEQKISEVADFVGTRARNYPPRPRAAIAGTFMVLSFWAPAPIGWEKGGWQGIKKEYRAYGHGMKFVGRMLITGKESGE